MWISLFSLMFALGSLNPRNGHLMQIYVPKDVVLYLGGTLMWLILWCNLPAERRLLWAELDLHKHVVRGFPWTLMGDLTTLTLQDYTIRGIKSQGVVEARIMGNSEFIDTFPGAYGVFQPYCISDHSPAWNVNIEGIKLDEVLKAFDKDLLDSNLRDEEATYIRAFIDAKLDEEHFLKQKAKIEWLEVGDSNSAFFHKSVKSRNQRSRIDTIRDAADCEVTGSLVAECFVNHYQQFLGTNMECVDLDSDGLFLNRVSVATSLKMVRNVSNEEVKIAMFSIGDDSAPDPDGFTSAFFKKSWDLVGNNICSAVKEFFNKGKLLKEINHTFLALILIVATPLKDCKVLVKKVSNRIGDWKNESLSYAGRHQLCRSVLSSMHVYWAAVLVIPIGIIQDIEQLMRCFLWCNGELKRGKAKCRMRAGYDLNLGYLLLLRGAWEALRPRGNEITWYHIVWFSHNIPRHAFNLWLIMRRSLKTQDRVRQWDVGPNVDLNTLRCKLCDAQPDSHEHLFFECPYSARIWILIRSLGGMELVSPRLHDIISYLQPIAHRRNARSVIGRILVAAAAYFIWVERNNRVFKNSRRSPEELRDAIIVTVRLKLLSFRFKNTAAVQDILARWKMPSSFRLYS
ncbi:reverse transcriptase domain, reverse transcriptase zinc-binding domain protein [Tanacetum coccineum]